MRQPEESEFDIVLCHLLSIMSSNSTDQYHHRYKHEDGDVTLSTSDGLKFRVHSFLLKTNSSVFRDMLDLARPSDDSEVILTEDSKTLASLLDFVYPSDAPSLPKPATLRDVNVLVEVSDKYNMPRVIASLRSIVLGEEKYRTSPIDLYALACKWKWQDVAEVASTETLKINLNEDECIGKLKQLDAADICRLLQLHAQRKRQIVQCLSPFVYDRAYTAPDLQRHFANCFCYETRAEIGDPDGELEDNTTISSALAAHNILKDFILGALERRPLGDHLIPNAFSHPMFDFVRDIECPFCKTKYFSLDSIAVDIWTEVDKWAVRSIHDIKD